MDSVAGWLPALRLRNFHSRLWSVLVRWQRHNWEALRRFDFFADCLFCARSGPCRTDIRKCQEKGARSRNPGGTLLKPEAAATFSGGKGKPGASLNRCG